jgi:hypothetical protein
MIYSIQSYSAKTSTPYLAHQYPSDAKRFVVHLDADHTLETVQAKDWEIGSWVNVIGYISPIPQDCLGNQCGKEFHRHGKLHYVVHVQAIMLWPAGPLQLDKYEKALEMRRGATG